MKACWVRNPKVIITRKEKDESVFCHEKWPAGIFPDAGQMSQRNFLQHLLRCESYSCEIVIACLTGNRFNAD